MDFPTQTDLQNIARNEIAARNPQISVDAVQREGSDANVLTASAAAVGDECIGQLVDVSASLFLDSASGTDLDRLVFDRYGITRKPAAAAIGSVQFTTTAANPAAFTINAGVQLATPTGQIFVTIAPVTFPLGSTGPVTASVRSTLAGANQQAAANTITAITSQITGSPSDLAVNNPLATAGAADDETDSSLRTRARAFFINARRGTLAAIQAAALAVPGVVTAETFEILDANGFPGREVLLVISDTFTAQLAQQNVNPPTYQQQSQILAQTVFAQLDDVRPAGIFVDVQVAQVILQPITLALTFSAGADVDSVTQQAIAAIVNYVNGLSPGQTLQYGRANPPVGLIGQLATVSGLIVSGADVISPPGDVVPTSLQALRTTPLLVAPISAVSGVALRTNTNPDA